MLKYPEDFNRKNFINYYKKSPKINNEKEFIEYIINDCIKTLEESDEEFCYITDYPKIIVLRNKKDNTYNITVAYDYDEILN